MVYRYVVDDPLSPTGYVTRAEKRLSRELPPAVDEIERNEFGLWRVNSVEREEGEIIVYWTPR